MTCRRTEDGGFWDGSEEERQAILRQCVISKADYVEIELDVADSIRRYGPTKRVISYTNLQETPGDILDLYDQARGKNPDVIKLVTLARTPEEAWPLVQIAAKAAVPTVIVGLGKANTMLALLGKRIGAPWIYAALERGMEAYPGQPTIDDLRQIFHVDSIDKKTRFVGVLGQGPRELSTIAALNAAFVAAEMNLRCLPLEIGNPKIFCKLIEVVKLAAVVVNADNLAPILQCAPELHGTARKTQAIDVLLSRDGGLHGYHKGAQAWVECLNAVLKTKFDPARPMKDRIVMLVGLCPSTRLLAAEIIAQGGSAIVATTRKKEGQKAAQELGCRFIQFEALYQTMHDALVVCDLEHEAGAGHAAAIHAGYLKAGQVVMDLTADLTPTPLLREAEQRGALVVSPLDIFLDQTLELARMLTNKPIARETLIRAVPERFLDSVE
jgi:3-dehydroquinate dehydratase/shikimate dehydrogenase